MIGETIKSVEELEFAGHDEVIITMESGRVFKIISHGYYGEDSSLELEELWAMNF